MAPSTLTTAPTMSEEVLKWVLHQMKVGALLLVLKVCLAILVVVMLVVLGFSWYQQQLRSQTGTPPQAKDEDPAKTA